MALNENNVFSGKFGGIEINGYDLLSIKSITVTRKVENNKREGTGHRANVVKYGLKSAGTMSCKAKSARMDNMGLKEFNRCLNGGKNPELNITVYSEDPNQYEGQIESCSFIGWISGDVDLFSAEDGKDAEIDITIDVDPSSFAYDSIVDGGRQDMFTKNA